LNLIKYLSKSSKIESKRSEMSRNGIFQKTTTKSPTTSPRVWGGGALGYRGGEDLGYRGWV
jgi:hypothetical protein